MRNVAEVIRNGRLTGNADGAAYADAGSEYAALGRDAEAVRVLVPPTSGRG
jgi:hypothetical protein